MRARLSAAALAAVLLAGCGSHKATEGHYSDAQAIATKLTKSGFTTGPLKPDTSGYIAQNGGKSYNTTIAGIAGNSGIDTFANADALKTWAGLSRGLGGVAVTGDTWAVSLPTRTASAKSASKAAAAKIAKALGGKVID